MPTKKYRYLGVPQPGYHWEGYRLGIQGRGIWETWIILDISPLHTLSQVLSQHQSVIHPAFLRLAVLVAVLVRPKSLLLTLFQNTCIHVDEWLFLRRPFLVHPAHSRILTNWKGQETCVCKAWLELLVGQERSNHAYPSHRVQRDHTGNTWRPH